MNVEAQWRGDEDIELQRPSLRKIVLFTCRQSIIPEVHSFLEEGVLHYFGFFYHAQLTPNPNPFQPWYRPECFLVMMSLGWNGCKKHNVSHGWRDWNNTINNVYQVSPHVSLRCMKRMTHTTSPQSSRPFHGFTLCVHMGWRGLLGLPRGRINNTYQVRLYNIISKCLCQPFSGINDKGTLGRICSYN